MPQAEHGSGSKNLKPKAQTETSSRHPAICRRQRTRLKKLVNNVNNKIIKRENISNL